MSPRMLRFAVATVVVAVAPAAAQQPAASHGAWVKLCDEKPCVVLHEQLKSDGEMILKAQVQLAEGEAASFTVKINRKTGILAHQAMNLLVYDRETLAKANRREPVAPRALVLQFTSCDLTSCTATAEMSPAFSEALAGAASGGGGNVVAAFVQTNGRTQWLEIPLNGYVEARLGSAIDGAVHEAERAKILPQPPESKPIAATHRANQWVKLCEATTFNMQPLPRYAERRDLCLTHFEWSEANVQISTVAIQQVQGFDKTTIMAMVPPMSFELSLKNGARAAVYAKGQWAKSRDSRDPLAGAAASLDLRFTFCHTLGCTAEATSDPLIEAMATGEFLVISATSPSGAPYAFEFPLAGFQQAYSGPPSPK